jgi:uncharacterized RDD family membrane protein YckC
MTPAGFWRRYAAWSLDCATFGLPLWLLLWPWMRRASHALSAACMQLMQLLQARMTEAIDAGIAIDPFATATRWTADPAIHAAAASVQSTLSGLLWPPLLIGTLAGALYHMVFEASTRQATPGQRALNLRVVDAHGQPIGALRALARHSAGTLSWLTLNLGHAMALLPPRKLALHDLVSGTRVVQDDDEKHLPAWARAWITLQLLALFGATLAGAMAASGAMRAGIDALG